MAETVLEHVLQQDLCFAKYQVKIDGTEDDFYIKARTMYLNKLQDAGNLIVKAYGDRRFGYMRCREELFSKKCPEKNSTVFKPKYKSKITTTRAFTNLPSTPSDMSKSGKKLSDKFFTGSNTPTSPTEKSPRPLFQRTGTGGSSPNASYAQASPSQRNSNFGSSTPQSKPNGPPSFSGNSDKVFPPTPDSYSSSYSGKSSARGAKNLPRTITPTGMGSVPIPQFPTVTPPSPDKIAKTNSQNEKIKPQPQLLSPKSNPSLKTLGKSDSGHSSDFPSRSNSWNSTTSGDPIFNGNISLKLNLGKKVQDLVKTTQSVKMFIPGTKNQEPEISDIRVQDETTAQVAESGNNKFDTTTVDVENTEIVESTGGNKGDRKFPATFLFGSKQKSQELKFTDNFTLALKWNSHGSEPDPAEPQTARNLPTTSIAGKGVGRAAESPERKTEKGLQELRKARRKSAPERKTFVPRAEKPKTPVDQTKNVEYTQFVGVHHIFSHTLASVTRVKFGRASQNMLAFSSTDHTITVSDLKQPSPTHYLLEGHRLGINDFDWSMTNEQIITCSSDKTLRIWDPLTKQCKKQITAGNEFTCCCFHPLNNSLVATGTKHSYLEFYNCTTGKEISHARIESPARAMVFSTDGNWLYVGCADGKIRWFKAIKEYHDFKYASSARLCPAHRAINSISYRDYHTQEKRVPALLVNIADSTVRMYRINHSLEGDKAVVPWFVCPIVNVSCVVRSSFAPMMLHKKEAYFATGSEDNNVYIYSYPTVPPTSGLARSKQVDALQGHGGPVSDVAWNSDETLLASADTNGTVIVWKRIKL